MITLRSIGVIKEYLSMDIKINDICIELIICLEKEGEINNKTASKLRDNFCSENDRLNKMHLAVKNYEEYLYECIRGVDHRIITEYEMELVEMAHKIYSKMR